MILLEEKNYASLQDILEAHPTVCFKQEKRTRIAYLNLACAFDIETTSFRLPPNPLKKNDDGEKRGCMYAYVLGINGRCHIGRTWDEFIDDLSVLKEYYGLGVSRRLVIYVHNLAFEFQFIRNLFSWGKVFATDDRKPIYAITNDGIEFRCSYLMSGQSLEMMANDLVDYRISKLVGDLDYSKPRHSKTPLTGKELGYIIHDGLVVMAKVDEEIRNNGDIIHIPYTKTGYVRRYVRDYCLYNNESSHKKADDKESMRYRKTIRNIPISGIEEYNILKLAFHGGFTHANPLYVCDTVADVTSMDFTSSYPSVMVCEKFPMGKGVQIKIRNLDEAKLFFKATFCIFEVGFKNLRAKFHSDYFLSLSKCLHPKNAISVNGRVKSADSLVTVLNDVDFSIFERVYEWDEVKFFTFWTYPKKHLPKRFVESVLKLYADKTTLKGVEGKEKEYMLSKSNLNSCFGMCVTDICKDEIEYQDGDWRTSECDFKKQIEKYNMNKGRFLAYQWGVAITAYAQRNLWEAILELKDDYLYSDTDSVKIINFGTHSDYFVEYNRRLESKMQNSMNALGIDGTPYIQTTVKGDKKLLGAWDYDGHYSRFKTLGAKRYMVETDDGEVSVTVSGLGKRLAREWFKGKDAFNIFTNDMRIPSEYSGRLIHSYIDEPTEGTLVDYLGNAGEYKEASSVNLEASDYTMSMSELFLEFLWQWWDQNKRK